VRRPVAVRVVGPLQWIVYPALAAVAATVVLATPLQVFGLHLPEPVAPMILAFAWPLIRPSMTAPAVLFVLGLFLDLFWNAPLGLWTLCLMAVYFTVLMSRNLMAGHDGLIRFGAYAACTLAAFALAYMIVAVRAASAPALVPLIAQIAPTLMLYPVANWMLERFDDGDIRFR
jgi:rod shape-determining protein MreD